MVLKLKEEYLDSRILCPFTRKDIYVRFIDSSMYLDYFNNGYRQIFNIEEV